MANKTLGQAKASKNDEFYTQRGDIENELTHYAEHFRDKIVYCNCDDPKESEFWQFFVRNFTAWELKTLIATHYDPDEKNFTYKIEAEPNERGEFSLFQEPTQTPLLCNGDFRAADCIKLLREADIVVTNPPFSLWREYVTQLIYNEKKFVIIGPLSGVKYKETFPLFRDNKIWLGYGFKTGYAYFRIKREAAVRYKHGVYNEKTGLVKFGNCCWYTNLDLPKRHDLLDLRGNYYVGNEDKYPRYTNFDGIDVANVNNLPCDYFGNMGVPISFMEHYNPEQFSIVGLGEGDLAKEIGITKNQRGRTDLEIIDKDGNFKRPYARIVIRRKEQDEVSNNLQ